MASHSLSARTVDNIKCGAPVLFLISPERGAAFLEKERWRKVTRPAVEGCSLAATFGTTGVDGRGRPSLLQP
jgi:hypothetical protein